METSRLINEITKLEANQKKRLKGVAYELQHCKISLENKNLPKDVTVDDIIKEEYNITVELFEFVCELVQGPDIRRKNSAEDLVKLKSIGSDLIYTVSKGRIKPS